MKILLKYVVWVYIILLSTSCSMYKKKLNSSSKVYSISTENEFELIEKNDLARTTYNNTTTKASPSNKLPKEAAPKVFANPTISAPDKLSAKNQERILEINQNLAFYCMKHRKSSRFESEEKCLELTSKILKSCEKEYRVINVTMVNCIKERLRKRR